MKKIILSALVLSLAFGVHAQEMKDRKTDRPMRHEGRMGKRGEAMNMQQLNLTADQKAAFKTQNESFRQKMQDLKKNDGITVKESREKMESIRKEHKANMDKILTADQKAQLNKRKTEGKAKMDQRMQERSSRMNEQLNLTADQSAKMKQHREVMMKQMKAIRENSSLTAEQKKEQSKELMKKQKESMKSILTEEQLNKMKEGRKERPASRKVK